MLLVIIESPLNARTGRGVISNQEYAMQCMKDSIARGEAPFASHLLYDQVLEDKNPVERRRGMEMGFAWGRAADIVAVYTDKGVSTGMQQGIDQARSNGITVTYRTIL